MTGAVDAALLTGEVLKVHVRHKTPDSLSTYKSFSIDLNVTSFHALQALVAKAFEIDGDLHMYSRPIGRSEYSPLLSDWDFQAAVKDAKNAASPLELEVRQFRDIIADWDIIEGDVQPSSAEPKMTEKSVFRTFGKRFLGIFTSNTAESSTTDSTPVPNENKGKKPMTDSEFRSFLDANGRLQRARAFRYAVFKGGVEPALRPVVWRHLLYVYPEGMSGAERILYTKNLAEIYGRLKANWQRRLRSRCVPDRLRAISSMVRKDVLRTDRSLPFYGRREEGDEANKNVLALFNLLTTFALAHPSIGYCQGMSDLASPLLFVLQSEADAYVLFCALMRRLARNFVCNGQSITIKFRHLSESLQYADPTFYEYLREAHADDLLFCYRWLLLELKREFAFEDALLMLESAWATLAPPAEGGVLRLFEFKREEEFYEFDGLPPQRSDSEECLAAEEMHKVVVEEKRWIRSARYSCPERLADWAKSSMVDSEWAKNDVLKSDWSKCKNDADWLTTDVLDSDWSKNVKLESDWPNALERRSDWLRVPPSGKPLCADLLLRSLALTQKEEEPEVEQRRYHATISGGGEEQKWTTLIERLRADLCVEKEPPPTCGSVPVELCKGRSFTPQETPQPPSDWCVLTSNLEETRVPEIACKESALEESRAEPAVLLAEDACVGADDLRLCDVEEIVRREHACCSTSTGRERAKSGECACCGRSEEKIRHLSAASAALPDSGFYSHLATPRSISTEFSSARLMTSSPCGGDDDDCSTPIGGGARAGFLPLPEPDQLGDGSAFMIFLCTALLVNQRDAIVGAKMDYNEIAMHFDKLVRRHEVRKLLRAARALFRRYLRMCREANVLDPRAFLSTFAD